MPSLSSKQNERKLLGLMLVSPTHMRAVTIPLDFFVDPTIRKAVEIVKQFVTKYKNPPTYETIKRFVDAKLHNLDAEKSEKIIEAITLIKSMPAVSPGDYDFEIEQATNYRAGRALVELAEQIKDSFDRGETDYLKLKKKILADMLVKDASGSSSMRGYIYDTIPYRINEYRAMEAGGPGGVIPYGIQALDNVLGGMRKSFVTLLYSKTGGGKTRTSVNIAYNAALAGHNVMYVSLEMSYYMIGSCFDSRMAWVDGNKIVFGKLEKTEKGNYTGAFRTQKITKPKIWLIDDSAMGYDTSRLLEDIEHHRAITGVNPDLVIIDYANLMEPNAHYVGRSEKYDHLFQELHSVAKHSNVAILTATQESRDASKADITARQKKAEVEQGVHNIGLSNYMAPHCETVIRLKQDSKDKLQNRLWAIIDKHRYGSPGTEIQLVALFDKNYVGDRTVNLNGLLVKNGNGHGAYSDDE
jgi:replicative DNA helicase